MPYIQRVNNQIIGYAENAPPSADEQNWEEISLDHPDIQTYLESIESIDSASWGEFRLAMMNNAAYQEFCDSLKPIFISGITYTVGVEPPHLPTLKKVWDAAIDSLPLEQQPNQQALTAWNQIAEFFDCPIRFASDGRMNLI